MIVRTLLRIAVAGIVLALLAHRIDVHAVGAALARTAPSAIVIATAAAFTANYVIAFRLKLLLASQGIAARAAQTFAINLSAFFYNLFLPVGGVGVAALRLQGLARHAGGRYTAALTAMICDRLAAATALGVIGLACWWLDPHAKPAGGIVVLLIGSATLGFMLAPRVVPRQVRRFVRELHDRGGGTWWAALLMRVANALGAVARLSPSTIAGLVAISLVAQLPGIVVFAALGHGLGLGIPFVSMGWLRSVVVLITILPISVGGLGVREGTLVLLLRTFGTPPADALALSLLFFATTILAPGLAGGVVEGLIWLRPSRSDHEIVKRP
jgi:uncharacterized membrane protein YbhN (UPF0104 family)